MAFQINHDFKDLLAGEDRVLLLQDTPLIRQGKLNHHQALYDPLLRQKKQAQFHADLRQNLHKYSSVQHSHLELKFSGSQAKGDNLLPHYKSRQAESGKFLLREDNKVEQNVSQKLQEPRGNIINLQLSNKVASAYERPLKKTKKPKFKTSQELITFLQENQQGGQHIQETDRRPLLQNHPDKKRAYQDALERARAKALRIKNQVELQDAQLQSMIRNFKPKKNLKMPQLSIEEVMAHDDQTVVGTALQQTRNLPTKQSIQNLKQRTANPVPLSLIKSGTASVLNTIMPTERMTLSIDELTKHEKQQLQAYRPSQIQLSAMKQQLAFMHQFKQQKGVAGWLSKLREKGQLQQQVFGKAKDQRLIVNKPGDRVVLEYRDSKGRLMTPKEAFKYMCWIFHGKGPSHHRLEKKRLRQAREQLRKQMTSQQSVSMRALKIHQEVNNQAYMQMSRKH